MVRILLFIVGSCAIFAPALALTDPTRPGVANAETHELKQKSPSQTLRLDLIKSSKNKYESVINGVSYRVGDKIKKDVITKILFDKVVFRSGNELYLFGNSVVRISK